MQDTDLTVLAQILAQRNAELDPSKAEAEFFEFFAAQQVLRDHQLDPEEIKLGLVGQTSVPGSAGTDGGIDAFYLLVNGRLIRDLDQAGDLKTLRNNIAFDIIIIQSSLESGFGLSRLLRLKDTCENIFRVDRSVEKFAEQYNQELLDSIVRFREAHRVLITKHPAFTVRILYVTRGDATKIAPSVQKKANEIECELQNLLATITKCAFTFVGARELIERFRKPPKSTFTLNCKNSIASGKSYLALVELAEWYAFIHGDNGELLEHLFESNVRDYQGDVEVNNQIRETLSLPSDSADFWWLNNGITVLSPKLGGHTQQLTVDDPQIVNGLQTSKEIYEHFRSNPNSEAGRRHTVVRLIESNDSSQQDRIIKATNSQTKIPPQYLWATDELQRDIEQLFRAYSLHYDRRKNSWRKVAVGLDKVVGITELAQAVASVLLQEPDHARARPSRYFKRGITTEGFSQPMGQSRFTLSPPNCESAWRYSSVRLKWTERTATTCSFTCS